MITYCSACPRVPESPGGATSSRAALLALVLPRTASRVSAVLFLNTERCRGALWVGLILGAPKPGDPSVGHRVGHTRTFFGVLCRVA